MGGIDQLVAAGRHLGQHAQPAERVDPLELAKGAGRHRAAARPVRAVGADDEVAVEPLLAPLVSKADAGAVAVEVQRSDILRLVKTRGPERGMGVHQVVGHFGLAVDRNMAASRRCRSIRWVRPCRPATTPRAAAPRHRAERRSRLRAAAAPCPAPGRRRAPARAHAARLARSISAVAMPASARSLASSNPAGPAPMIATCTRTSRVLSLRPAARGIVYADYSRAIANGQSEGIRRRAQTLALAAILVENLVKPTGGRFMKTIKGPALFLGQFAGDAAPFDTLGRRSPGGRPNAAMSACRCRPGPAS